MDFELTDEQRLLMQVAHSFMTKECPRQYLKAIDEKGEFPYEFWRKTSQLG